MYAFSIPQLSLGTTILVIFLICMCLILLRGLARVLVGSSILALSVWVGFLCWQQLPGLSVKYIGQSNAIANNVVPFVVFLISLVSLLTLAKVLARPFGFASDDDDLTASDFLRLGGRLLLALIPTAIIVTVICVVIHHAGAVAEVGAFSRKSQGKSQPAPAQFTQELKQLIEEILPASWLRALDPLSDAKRLTLAKIITNQSNGNLKPVIDPKTKKPIPRAIVVDEPELKKLALEGKFGALLRHPRLTKTLNDPKIQALIGDLKL